MADPREDTWPTQTAPVVVDDETVVAEPPPPPDRRIGWGMLLALVVIALIVLGAVLAWLLTHRSSNGNNNTNTVTTVVTTQATPTAASVTMPDVRGQTLKQARTTLSNAGLKTAVTTVTSGKPAGTVVDQAPKSGAELTKGATVTLSVSKPPQPAQTTQATQPTQTTTPTPTTTAAATTPAQPTTATVPDVSGNTTQAAAQALNQAGLLASLVFVPSDQPLGTVVQQAKQSGTTVPFHSHVQINLSRGTNQNPNEQVPNVIGRTLDEAVSAMQGANLRLIYVKSAVTSRAQAGKIVQQSPLGGGNAPRNAQVLVYLGAFKAQ
jgi:eukaryotic-like serine/threonine-protein kinase